MQGREPHRFLATILIAIGLSLALSAPSLASASMGTRGGPVEAQPHVYAIFWGSDWSGGGSGRRAEMESLYNQISGSSWAGILTQYWSPQGFSSGKVALSSYV